MQPEKTTHTRNKESRDGTVSFTLQRGYDSHSVEAIPPRKTGEFITRNKNTDQPYFEEYKSFIEQNSAHHHDGYRGGWTLFTPISFSISMKEDRLAISESNTEKPDNFLTFTQHYSEDILRINTFWDVEFPTGYTGMITPLYINSLPRSQVIPTVCGGEKSNRNLIPVVRIHDEVQFTKGQPIAQLYPLPEEDITIDSDAWGEEEWKKVHNEERRRRIYPETYAKERRGTFNGNIEIIPQRSTPSKSN